MGHGDKLILSDSNFPAYSMNSRVHRLDGVMQLGCKSNFIGIPLDSFIGLNTKNGNRWKSR